MNLCETRHGRCILHTTLHQPLLTCERVPDTAKSAEYWYVPTAYVLLWYTVFCSAMLVGAATAGTVVKQRGNVG